MTTQFSTGESRLDVLRRELDDVLAIAHGLIALDVSGTVAMVKPRSLRSWTCGASSVKALAPLVPSPGTVKTDVAPFGTAMAPLAFSALEV